MRCPRCNSDSIKVLDSRDAQGGHAVRRRRACEKCGHRYTTYERIERPKLIVVKKDQMRETFNRDKVAHGIWRALEKRPVSQEKVDQLLDELEEQLASNGEQEVPSTEIGEIVMEKLKSLDDVAYIRFASVYRSFTDAASFKKELKKLES